MAAASEIEVTGEALVLPANRGLAMIAYSVEPNCAAAGSLQLLASWAASADQPITAETPVRRNG